MIKIFAHILLCDTCREGALTEFGSQTAWAVIQKSQEEGWTRFGEKDICPACRAKRDDETGTMKGSLQSA